MKFKWLLDPKLGGKLRTVVYIVSYVAAVVAAIQSEAAATGGALSLPAIVQIFTHLSTKGNQE